MRIDTLPVGLARATAIAAVMVLGLTAGLASAADNNKPAQRKDGGVAIKLPQSPPMMPVDIGYLREEVAGPRPASRLDVEPDNAGIAGAEMGIKENNAGGRFMGHLYGLDVETASSPEEAVDALTKLYESGHNYIVVDASAPTLLKLSDWAADKDILLFNIRAEDVSLRQEDCRANVMHVVPDRYMLADALAQYLVKMGWTDWLVVHGSTDADKAYRDAVLRAAERFGGNIVDDREYVDVSGGRRDGVGPIPPAKPHKEANASHQMIKATDYDVIVVADEDQIFGPLMPYRGGGQPRVVAGTTGLTATTWSRGHEKWGATQANNNFEKANDRLMLPIDHMAYVATRTIGEAVTRKPKNDFETVSAFIHGPDLQLAPFKGIKQQFRPWDGQFRQPILIATEKVPVSVSPQKGFPHASHPEIEVDTLGIDEPESKCKM
ncbi:ABC transporter substrate-binding protein [Methyloceanibacter sp. wino2]|uniref:ABC transporter substrate-binding protein n=1 Tax=Methyloceanibacter sp. wino2 TaxID=2170729 RepID=UPI000D3E8351|nr:ABC transporter substrate-binding protein [Methyloceanibacter sp. wino2]